MKWLLLCAILLAAAAHSGIRLFIDGQPVGTLSGSGIVYDLAAGEIRIETAEGVYGCRLDLVFRDDFEVKQ